MSRSSRWAGKRILITGRSGVIGQALLAACDGFQAADVTGISSADVDLRDQAATEAFFAARRPNLVFHLAARVSGIMGNMRDRAAPYLDNVRINTNVIEAARLAGAQKIVAMGTTAIYSDLVPMPMREEDLWLGKPHRSERPYGHAKRAMLAQLEAYKEQYGLDYAYCICTNLYGPHDKFDEENGHVIPALISKFHRAVASDERVNVWGTGEPQRDFLFSADAAAALMLIAESGYGPINLASGRSVSIRECADLLADLSAYRHAIEWDNSKPNGQMRREYSVVRLAELGFAPRYDLRTGLARTLEWFDANRATLRR